MTHESTVEADDPPFNLIDEPWITVRMKAGSIVDLSIADCFMRHGEIREVVGELPTQSFAIIRLLLAIVHRAVGKFDSFQWGKWWKNGLPLAEIQDYLDEYHNRFGLFDRERPFFQVASLHTQKNEFKGIDQLVFDFPRNNSLFTNRAEHEIESLSFAEAARWLINTQAFDTSGIKSGAIGDPRVKGGRGYPIGVAWSGLIGGLLVEGNDLGETLLLNLTGRESSIETSENDIPPWEEDHPDDAAERPNLYPEGPVRLYTWQSRRVRLNRFDGRVVSSQISNGDKLTPQNKHLYEPMTAWRFSKPQTKKNGTTTYMPQEHRPERAFWRGVPSLLASSSTFSAGSEPSPRLAPGVVGWLRIVQLDNELDLSFPVRFRAIGVTYGSNDSVVDDIIDDRVTLSLALLNDSNASLVREAENAISLAESCINILKNLAENLALAGGGESEGPRVKVEAASYAALDGPYRAWLSSLEPGADPVQVVAAWKRTVSTVIRASASDLMNSASPAAWAGRDVQRLNKSEYLTASRAYGWFNVGLKKVLGTVEEVEATN